MAAVDEPLLEQGGDMSSSGAGSAGIDITLQDVGRRLHAFVAMNRLKKIALNVIASELTESEIGDLRQLFDEIDTDVSGRVSESIAEIMETMGKTMQVFAITHLPQVAARGHHHFKVFKTTEASRTETQLQALDSEARIHEIAMMLSGNEISVTALAHAKELLN